MEKKFLLLQEESLQELRRRWEEPEGRNYLVCPELECPVCLVEMVPPTRIWQCRSISANILMWWLVVVWWYTRSHNETL